MRATRWSRYPERATTVRQEFRLTGAATERTAGGEPFTPDELDILAVRTETPGQTDLTVTVVVRGYARAGVYTHRAWMECAAVPEAYAALVDETVAMLDGKLPLPIAQQIAE